MEEITRYSPHDIARMFNTLRFEGIRVVEDKKFTLCNFWRFDNYFEFKNCVFDRCIGRFVDARHSFKNCEFSGAYPEEYGNDCGLEFGCACTFENVKFSGNVKPYFNGCEMEGVHVEKWRKSAWKPSAKIRKFVSHMEPAMHGVSFNSLYASRELIVDFQYAYGDLAAMEKMAGKASDKTFSDKGRAEVGHINDKAFCMYMIKLFEKGVKTYQEACEKMEKISFEDMLKEAEKKD